MVGGAIAKDAEAVTASSVDQSAWRKEIGHEDEKASKSEGRKGSGIQLTICDGKPSVLFLDINVVRIIHRFSVFELWIFLTVVAFSVTFLGSGRLCDIVVVRFRGCHVF